MDKFHVGDRVSLARIDNFLEGAGLTLLSLGTITGTAHDLPNSPGYLVAWDDSLEIRSPEDELRLSDPKIRSNIERRAREWADGPGFAIVANRFTGDGPYELNADPRDLLIDAYIALAGHFGGGDAS